MQLLIKKLGAIKNNTQPIDLAKRFYIFVGLNNSGKTYVSQLLWTIFNEKNINQFAKKSQIKNKLDINSQEHNEIEITPQIVEDILEEFAEFIKAQLVETYNTNQYSWFTKDISLAFQFNEEEIYNYGLELNFNINIDDQQNLKYIVVEKNKNSNLVSVAKKEMKEIPIDFFDKISKQHFEQHQKVIQKTISESLIAAIIGLLLKHNHATFFLPASRIFYPIFYRYIYDIERRKREQDIKQLLDLIESSDNLAQVSPNKIREIGLFKRSYTEPMNQVFEAIYSLNTNTQSLEYYTDLVKQLMGVMGGDISMEKIEGISPIDFAFNFGQENKNLPMYLASSAANQLSLLYFYLKYWVEKEHNFLMMDEPEENLHPENQTLLLDLLVQFAKKNDNKVLITTHSPLMANAVNNYVYLSVLKNKYNCNVQDIVESNNLQYVNPNTSLAPEELGVYFFNGNKIIDYETDDYGAYFRKFRQVEEGVDKSRNILTDYIYELENE
ncbi:AAA family ATPase [Spirulina sp. CS-785/01]|uniref:AAA family ATPase n=1 Tax=Spirulina sp. CS-785/01 TaxID=3021716 RepID=UPI00232BDB6D|nr:AAA family ATPase [Spirulina sp. CS-785/01]MDB9315649.1 AAA family ATPase [Spirulina sp. CS-785/01]